MGNSGILCKRQFPPWNMSADSADHWMIQPKKRHTLSLLLLDPYEDRACCHMDWTIVVSQGSEEGRAALFTPEAPLVPGGCLLVLPSFTSGCKNPVFTLFSKIQRIYLCEAPLGAILTNTEWDSGPLLHMDEGWLLLMNALETLLHSLIDTLYFHQDTHSPWEALEALRG